MKEILVRFFIPVLITSLLSGCMQDDPGAKSILDAPPNHSRYLVPKGDHPFRYSQPGEPVRLGAVSERYELRDGDCGGVDCTTGASRTESVLSAAATKARFNEDIWYGWSFYNENIRSYSQSVSLAHVFGQWKQGGGNPPSMKLVQIGRGEAYRSGNRNHDVVIQLDDANEGLNWGDDRAWGIVCRLFSIDEVRGRWTDIVINTNFGTDGNGYLRIWIDGEQRCDYRGPIVITTDRSLYPGPNHRRGIYVSYPHRWSRVQPNTPQPTRVAYYDEFRVGRSRAEVDIRMIEQRGGAAVD